MISEFFRAAFSLVRSPLLLLVALAGVLANYGLALLFSGPLLVLIGQFSLDSGFPATGDAYWFYMGNAGQINALLGLVFLSIVINSFLALVFARFARRQQERKTEVLESVSHGVSKWGFVIAWSLLVFLVGLAGLILLGIVFWLNGIHWILALLAGILWLLGALVVLLVLTLGLPVAGIEELSIKDTLKKSGSFVATHFFGFLAFLVAVAIVLGILNGIGNALGPNGDEDWTGLIVILFFWLCQIVVSNLGISFYYLTSTQGTPKSRSRS